MMIFSVPPYLLVADVVGVVVIVGVAGAVVEEVVEVVLVGEDVVAVVALVEVVVIGEDVVAGVVVEDLPHPVSIEVLISNIKKNINNLFT